MSSSFDNFYLITGQPDRVKEVAAFLKGDWGHLSHDKMPEKEEEGRIEFYHWSKNCADAEWGYSLSKQFPDVNIRCCYHSAEAEQRGVFNFKNCEFRFHSEDFDPRKASKTADGVWWAVQNSQAIPEEWWTTFEPPLDNFRFAEKEQLPPTRLKIKKQTMKPTAEKVVNRVRREKPDLSDAELVNLLSEWIDIHEVNTNLYGYLKNGGTTMNSK